VRRAALAIADEAEQGVLARPGEIELGDLLRTAVDPGGIGDVPEVERRVGASCLTERLAHLSQRGAGLKGTAITWCGSVPVFENSIVFFPTVSPEALKPYSYASILATAAGSSPAELASPSTLKEASPNFKPLPSFWKGAS
jgi:hypothetical protein